jgi:hypothetical protein
VVFIRIIGAATALVLAFMILSWLFTGERKWLVFRVALVIVVAFLLLLFGEALFD